MSGHTVFKVWKPFLEGSDSEVSDSEKSHTLPLVLKENIDFDLYCLYIDMLTVCIPACECGLYPCACDFYPYAHALNWCAHSHCFLVHSALLSVHISAGAETKRPVTKRPEGQNVQRKNFRWPNIHQTKRPSDKTSGGTKHPLGQNIRRPNVPAGRLVAGCFVWGDKRPAEQNVRRDKRPFANICGPTLLNPASKHSFTKNKNNHFLLYEAIVVPCRTNYPIDQFFSILWRYVHPQNDHVTLRPKCSSPMDRHGVLPISGKRFVVAGGGPGRWRRFASVRPSAGR